MSVLDVRNLSVQYPTENGAAEIVKDISFKVEKGEIAGLVESPVQERVRPCWR